MDQLQSQHLISHQSQHQQYQEHSMLAQQQSDQPPFQQSQQQNIMTIIKSEDANDNNSPVSMPVERTNDNTSQNQQQADEMMQQLMILYQRTQDTDAMVQSNRDLYQNFVIQLQMRGRLINSIGSIERAPQVANQVYILEKTRRDLQTLENVLKTKALQLNNIRKQLIKDHCDIFDKLLEIQNKTLYEYLPRWHHEQQLINNGVKIDTIKLDIIQSWVEKIVEIIWKIKNQIKGLQLTLTERPNLPFDTEDLDKFVVCVNKALENLIMNSFVVEKQPPQVMKTNTKFTASVRFLCGNKLNVQMINPTVKAIILSEANARAVIRYHKQLIEKSNTPFENYQTQQQMQPQNHPCSGQPMAGVGSSPAHQLAPNPQNMSMDHSGLNYGHSVTNQSNDHNSEQQQYPISLVDHQLHHGPQAATTQHQQTFQQFQQQQQQAIPSQMAPRMNMTAQQQHYNSITEIGYNPDVPINMKDFESSGEILNNSNILEYQDQTGHMISYFRNMQLKKIKRTEKKGTESVMDEKFILLFFTEFRVADDSFWLHSHGGSSMSRIKRGDLLFHILAFSLPVVVIVHGNQEPHAWATITWHNAFATQDDELYQVPDKVKWSQLGDVLSEKFRSCAGRGLSKQNLKYLAGKVYRNRVDSDDVLISWNQFAKESLADRSFTFWEWFHSILKLTREYLRDLWKADRIWGFVGKKGCVDLLLGSSYTEPAPQGTFLLRYSETELGGITIAWVASSSDLASENPTLNDKVQISHRMSPTNSSTNVVMHLQPSLSSDLKTRSLADRIRDLKDLVYLYPNIPKDEAFKAYYSPISDSANSSYIPAMLVTTIASNYAGSLLSSLNLMTLSPQSNTYSDSTNNQNLTQISGSQCSPESYYHENISMTDVIESNYPSYDQVASDFNYTIQ